MHVPLTSIIGVRFLHSNSMCEECFQCDSAKFSLGLLLHLAKRRLLRPLSRLSWVAMLLVARLRNVRFAKWHAYSRHTSRKYCYIFLYILNLPFVILAYFVYTVV